MLPSLIRFHTIYYLYPLSCFSYLVERSGVSPLMVCYLFYSRLYPSEEDFSMAEEGFFHGLGPWPSIDIEMGLLVFFPPQYIYKILPKINTYKKQSNVLHSPPQFNNYILFVLRKQLEEAGKCKL